MTSIREQNKVLEVGPGSSPHPRSNAFLELNFMSEKDRIAQCGGGTANASFSAKPVYYYDGGRFPFEDNQFDYVICSHVIEHVKNPAEFMNEIFRIGGGRGYVEYPIITCEYLYNFDVHLHFVKLDSSTDVPRYLPMDDTFFRTSHQ